MLITRCSRACNVPFALPVGPEAQQSWSEQGENRTLVCVRPVRGYTRTQLIPGVLALGAFPRVRGCAWRQPHDHSQSPPRATCHSGRGRPCSYHSLGLGCNPTPREAVSCGRSRLDCADRRRSRPRHHLRMGRSHSRDPPTVHPFVFDDRGRLGHLSPHIAFTASIG